VEEWEVEKTGHGGAELRVGGGFGGGQSGRECRAEVEHVGWPEWPEGG